MFFDFWEDAKENMVQAGKERMRKLVLKYGEKPDEDDMAEADWFEYQAVKKYEDEVTGEMNRGEFLCQRKANIYDLSRIFDKTADEARQVFNLAAKKSVNLLPETVKHAYYEAERLTPIKMSDENKHQYVSCVGAQGGVFSASTVLAGAALKEGKDLYRKLSNGKLRKMYGGIGGVIGDSVKDMENNLYGSGYGLMYRERGACDVLKKHKIK